MPSAPTEPNPSLEAEFLANLPLIEAISSYSAWRVGLFAADAEDFSSFVKQRLIEDDYDILRQWKRRSGLGTYLTTVIRNLARDYKAVRAGRYRPTAYARRLGPTAVLFEQLIVRDGYPFEEACETILARRPGEMSRADLERIAEHLPARSARQFVSDDLLVNVSARGDRPDQAIARDEHRKQMDNALRILQAIRATLPSQDQVILAMRYDDGLTVAEIATTLRLEQQPLYRRIDAMRARLGKALAAAGVEASVLESLESE